MTRVSPPIPHARPRGATPRSRGYVLAITLLLLIVIGLLAATTSQRQVANALTVKRQLNAYREHHGAMGLQAAVQMWLRVQRATSIRGLLGYNGHAFDLEFQDGSTISVYLRSGQGSALTNLSAIDTEQVLTAAKIVQELNLTLTPGDFAENTREVGPAAIDLVFASEPVIRAGANAVTDDPTKAELLGSLLIRGRVGATRNTLSQAGVDADLSSDERNTLYSVFTTTTTLWRVHLEVRRGLGNGEVVARYEGLTVLNTQGTGLDKDFTVSGGFLEWDAVPLDQGPGGEG